MGVITISREYGSNGRVVAQKLAFALGYRYVNRDLIREVARTADVPESDVEACDEHAEHPMTRILKRLLVPVHNEAFVGIDYGWAGCLPVGDTEMERIPAIDEDSVARLTREAIVRLAFEGNAVILGRGGQAALDFPSAVLHVRIVAPLAYRMQTAVRRDGVVLAEARHEVLRIDTERRRYVRRYYGIDGDDPGNYDLVINTGRMGVDGAIHALVEAARDFPGANLPALGKAMN